MGILTPKQRAAYLDFVAKNAGDDIVIAAALRTMYNIQEAGELDKFIGGYRPSVIPSDLRHVMTGVGEVESEGSASPSADQPVEDLGPAPKKLGSNGQKILKLMTDKKIEFTVDGLHKATGIVPSKVKPMLALLLERGQIARAGPSTYRVK